MNHSDHVALLRPAGIAPGGTWADLGSGSGAFTLALADLLGPDGFIHSVDKDERALREQQQAMQDRFPNNIVSYIHADFTRPLELPSLDGVVMANSLHFHRDKDKDAILQRVRGYLKPDGKLLIVEYNADGGNPWVPYPFSYGTWEKM